jgi:hypothetical protein
MNSHIVSLNIHKAAIIVKNILVLFKRFNTLKTTNPVIIVEVTPTTNAETIFLKYD